jgi:hypothetical protein
MGGFIPSPNDQEIIAKLNFLFSGDVLNKKMKKPFLDKNKQPLFPAKNLSRVARRIGAFPNTTSDANGRNPRARWYVFLEKLPNATKQDINDLLADATDPQTGYDGVVFDLTHEPAPVGQPPIPPYIAKGSGGGAGEIVTFPDGKTILFMTLVCDQPIPTTNDTGNPKDDRPNIGKDPGGTKNNENDFWAGSATWMADDNDY